MATVLKTRLVRIGNSQGIRIPRLLLDQVGLESGVELEGQPGQLVIRPAQAARLPRQDWEEQFATMAERGDDRLLDPDMPPLTTWDADEWEW